MTITSDDKIAIQELCNKIYLCLDAKDASGFTSGFVPDGIFATSYGDFEGAEKVRVFIESQIAAGKEDGVRHIVTNPIVEAHEAGARYRASLIKLNVAVGPSFLGTAVVDAVVVRATGGWRFQRLELSIDTAMLGKLTSHLTK